MATIFKAEERSFQESPKRIDPYQSLTDVSRAKKGVNPENLNFDLRQLNPGDYSAPYHFHRYAEELFVILSGSGTIRTPEGFEVVKAGDLIFFEKGESGAHQLHNHTDEPCVYLDLRTYIGYDVCEYPDSNKVLMAPSFEIFDKDTLVPYFKGEEDIEERWKKLTEEKE